MSNSFLFGFVAFVSLCSIIVFISQYVRAGSTIVTLKRPQGINVLSLGGFILIAWAIWTTVSSQSSDTSLKSLFCSVLRYCFF